LTSLIPCLSPPYGFLRKAGCLPAALA